MEVNSTSGFNSQDNLAAEVLTKLQSGSGFSTVAAPEGILLQPPHVGGSSFLPDSSPALNPCLLPQTIISQNTDSAGSVTLNSAGALEPAQTGNTSLGGVCGPPPAPPNSGNSVTVVSALPSSANPAPSASQDAMTITVQCTISDTIIIVGQQSWQCCMCQEICGFDSSIDQHLSQKHNLCLKPTAAEEGRAMSKGGPTQSEEKHCDGNKVKSPADSGNDRSGLEREVALLMAQTFTHSGGMDEVDEDVKHCDDSLVMSFSQEKQTDSAVSFTGASNSRNTSEELSSTSAEVRNSKDLKIPEDSDCHEKDKNYKWKYRCLVCHKLFKYIHTLYQHMVQENHQGGLPDKPDPSQSPDHESNDFTDEISFETGLKMEVDEPEEAEMFDVDLPSISSEAPAVSSESKGNRAQKSGEPAYEKILAALLSEGKQISSPSGRKPSLLKCFVCDQEIRNHNYYITRHARCHMEDLCYTCLVCKMEFYRHDHYRDHMLQHGIVSSLKGNENVRVTRSKTKACEVNQKQSNGKAKKGWDHPKPTTVCGKISDKGPKPTKGSGKICDKKLKKPKPATASGKARDKQIFKNLYSMKKKAQQHSIGERELTQSSPQSPSSSRSESRSAGSRQHFVVRCHVCGMTFQSHAQKRLHMLKHRCTFQCRFCDAKFDSGAELLSHSQNCEKTGSRTFVPSISDMDIKPESESRSEDDDQPASNEGVRGPAWKKEASGQVSPTPPRKWTCSICDAVIVHSLPSISRHMRELHSDRERRRTTSPRPQPHRCRKCYRPFVSFAKLQHHLKTRHRDFEGICDVCGKTFRTKAAFRKHTMLHTTPEGKFQCPKCRFSFRYESRLEKHMRKHADRTGVCPHCGKVYISKIHLQRHISVEHLGIKDYRYKCDQCDAQFFEKLQLRDHIAYHHKGIQIYTCKYCHRGFNARPTLVRHERLEHTNYLPHKCKHCPQAFAEKSKLVAHEMTHTGMSPHKCEVCGKYFTTGSALRIHKNLHLGIRPFECGACGKSYLKKWNLQQHVRKVHKMFDVTMAAYSMSMPPLNQQQ